MVRLLRAWTRFRTLARSWVPVTDPELLEAVRELGDRLGIPVPHVRTVHACAKLLDSLSRSRPAPEREAVTAEVQG